MTARSLLLCCGVMATLAAAPVSQTNATTTVPAIDNAAPAFPGSVREVSELIVEADETLRFKGPVEFRVAGEVRIDGMIVVDGIEISGRPNLTIRALGPITVSKGATLQTLSHGPGAHGGSIRLFSPASIDLHGALVPSAGNDGRTIGQHGGDGGSIEIEAPIIRTSLERIEASSGGLGAAAGNGGDGGSVRTTGAVLWQGNPNLLTTTLVAGHGADGGDGSASATTVELRSGGNAGDGGNAEADDWRLPDWLDELAFIEDEDAVRRLSSDALDGERGGPGQPGQPGEHGAHAISGHGGNGGQGTDALPLVNTDGEYAGVLPAGNGGNGGHAGFARGAQGGAGGTGGSTTSLDNANPMFGMPGGRGGDGGAGGSARSGNGGDGGLGGKYPDLEILPAHLRGRAAHDGHGGHGAQAMGGHGGHGGHAGHGFGQAASGGAGGSGGVSIVGTSGLSGEERRNAERAAAARDRRPPNPGHDGHNGHDGRTFGERPAN